MSKEKIKTQEELENQIDILLGVKLETIVGGKRLVKKYFKECYAYLGVDENNFERMAQLRTAELRWERLLKK